MNTGYFTNNYWYKRLKLNIGFTDPTWLKERLDIEILWKADMGKFIPKSTIRIWFSIAFFRPTKISKLEKEGQDR